MTSEEAITWCAEYQTTVKFDPRGIVMGPAGRTYPGPIVLVSANCGTQLCHGNGSTFVEAVEACDAYLTRVLEARDRAKEA